MVAVVEDRGDVVVVVEGVVGAGGELAVIGEGMAALGVGLAVMTRLGLVVMVEGDLDSRRAERRVEMAKMEVGRKMAALIVIGLRRGAGGSWAVEEK